MDQNNTGYYFSDQFERTHFLCSSILSRKKEKILIQFFLFHDKNKIHSKACCQNRKCRSIKGRM